MFPMTFRLSQDLQLQLLVYVDLDLLRAWNLDVA